MIIGRLGAVESTFIVSCSSVSNNKAKLLPLLKVLMFIAIASPQSLAV